MRPSYRAPQARDTVIDRRARLRRPDGRDAAVEIPGAILNGVLTAGAGQHTAKILQKELMLMSKSVKRKSILTLVLCIVLAAATVLCMAGCKKVEKAKDTTTKAPANPDETATENPGETATEAPIEVPVGSKQFEFKIVHKSGETKTITIYTDKDTVGAALVEKGLIAGDNSDYGLYVKTVDGETLDYNKDGMYWAFYINGEYAMTGVDSTNIEEGKVYTFKAEAA